MLSGDGYTINKPDTPRPWRNLIYNQNYLLVIAQNGIGFSRHQYLEEPITASSEQSGRFIFIRDNDTGEFWSATWYPVNVDLDQFHAVHHLGKTVVSSQKNKISAQIEFSVHRSLPFESWQIEIANQDKQKRRLSVFAFVEWGGNIQASQFHDNAIIATAASGDKLTARIFTLDRAVDSFDCDWEQFVGRYGNLSQPKALLDGKCSRSFGTDNRIAVLQKNLTLGPGAKANFAAILGASAVETSAQAKRLAKTWVKSLSNQVQALPERVMIKSPEHNLNLLVNYWSRLQALSPTAQDATTSERLEKLSLVSAYLAEQITPELVEILSHQYRDGSLVRSVVEPVPDESVETVSKLVEALAAYLTETGDLSLLSKDVSFFDSGSGTITEHLIRGCNLLLGNLKLNNQEIYEKSVAISVLRRILPILTQIGEQQFVRKIERVIDEQSLVINRQYPKNPKQTLNTTLAVLGAKILSQKNQKSAVNHLKSHLKNLAGTEKAVQLKVIIESVEQLAVCDCTEDAVELLENYLPTNASKSVNQYQAEPYLFPSSILLDTRRFAQADKDLDNTAAAKFLSVLVDTVLGIKPTLGGLKIDPHVPRSWRQYEVSREFRGATYHIRIYNPLRATGGVSRLSVNGLHITGNVIQPFKTGNHFVEVTLG